VQLVVDRFGRGIADIGRQMHLAALPGRSLELHTDRMDQAAVVY
jgi:hypothetical protein